MARYPCVVMVGAILCAALSSLPLWASDSVETTGRTPLVTQRVILRALDKVTGHVKQLEVGAGETVSFEKLRISARSCRKSLPEDPPESLAFLEIQEEKAGRMALVFSGWMFASTPSISAMEHPVYDVWVVECTGAQHEETQKDRDLRVETLTLHPGAQTGGIVCETEENHVHVNTAPLPGESTPDITPLPTPEEEAAQMKAFHDGLNMADDDQPPVGVQEEHLED